MNKEIKVVVVDDNEAVLSSVKKYFNNSELINIVGTFNNGKVALDYLINNSSEYDLAILDILLPQIDGIKILQEMKNNNINKNKFLKEKRYILLCNCKCWHPFKSYGIVAFIMRVLNKN